MLTKSSLRRSVSEIWVVNASPIITLAKAGYLNLLNELAGNVEVPEPVADEILLGASSDPARRAIERGWGQRTPVENVPKRVLEWGLGAGESAVLTVALQRTNAVAILDDAMARKSAQTMGIEVTGTLGVAVRAKLHNLIPSAVQVVRALRAAGLYMDSGTISKALSAVDEEWTPL
jgi:predicted nucleic acid-binding protein